MWAEEQSFADGNTGDTSITREDADVDYECDNQEEVQLASVEDDANHLLAKIHVDLKQQLRRRKRKRKKPQSYAPRCTGCVVQQGLDQPRASVWCCECARNLCTKCDERLHSGNSSLDPLHRPMCSHRVEIIVGGGGIAVLTPMLEISVLIAGLFTLRPLLSSAGRALNVDYFFESVCPLVSRIRRIVFRVDHALYPVLKGPLGVWCETEDAFLKIFVDVWVRGVLTKTDSWALMIMKTPAAIGAFVVVLTLVPLLSIPYAAVATPIRFIEMHVVPNWAVFRLLGWTVRRINDLLWLPFWVAAWFCRATILGLVMDHDMAETFHRRRPIPPKTGHRLRPSPSYGIRDISGGCLTRITRIFRYFRRRARKAITSAILTSVFFAFSLRVFLLYSPRCGGEGIIGKAVWEVVDAIEGGDHEQAPQCVSVHHLSRKFAKRFGVEVPELEGLGKDAEILKSLQEATGNDYIDETLRNASRRIYNYVSEAEFRVKAEICIIIGLIFFAGVLRRIIYWADLHRRYRWIGKIVDAIDDAGINLDGKDDDESTSSEEEESVAKEEEPLKDPDEESEDRDSQAPE